MKTQRILIISALVFLAATVLWAPWLVYNKYSTHAPLFFGVDGARLQWSVLLSEWLAIAALHYGLWHLLRNVTITPRLVWKSACVLAVIIVALWGIALRISNG